MPRWPLARRSRSRIAERLPVGHVGRKELQVARVGDHLRQKSAIGGQCAIAGKIASAPTALSANQGAGSVQGHSYTQWIAPAVMP